ncbi:MAG: nuclear transport factor 2 family protein [Vicinamibacterales bacterium]
MVAQSQTMRRTLVAAAMAVACSACQGNSQQSVTSTQSAPEKTAAAAPSSATPKVDRAEVADTVRTVVTELVAAINAHDVEKVVSHDAPDIVAMFHGTPNVVGPEEDKKTTAQLLADPAAHLRVTNETVDVAEAGDLAIYRATHAFTMTDPRTKKPVVEPGNWVVALKPGSGGTWQVIWDVVSDTGPAVQAAASKTK